MQVNPKGKDTIILQKEEASKTILNMIIIMVQDMVIKKH
jgi:hypothetical protein